MTKLPKISLKLVYKLGIVASLTMIVLFSRLIPVFYSVANTPPGFVFSGQNSVFDPSDINVYVSAIRFGQSGKIALKNQFSTTDTYGTFIYPLYTVSGYLVRQVDPYVLFQIVNSICIILLCLTIFFCSLKLLNNFFYAALSILLVTRGGGFGWIFEGKILTGDLYYSGFTFLTALQRAHEGFGMTLYISSMVTSFYFMKDRRLYMGVLSFVFALLMIFFYSYYLLIYMSVSAIFLLYYFSKKSSDHPKYLLLRFIKLIILGIVMIGYYSYLSQSGFYSATEEQLDKIGPVALIVGYGVFISLFACLIYLKRNSPFKFSETSWFLIVWVSVALLWSYSPIGYARLFVRGLFFPLVVLSIIAIRSITQIQTRKIVLTAFTFLMLISSVYLFDYRIHNANPDNQWTYIPQEVNDSFDFLSERRRDGILSYYWLGNMIPAKTNKAVYFGHWTQTPDAKERAQHIALFYSGKMTEEEALQFLKENKINFIVYGPEEKTLGGHIYSFLLPRFSNTLIQIYSIPTQM